GARRPDHRQGRPGGEQARQSDRPGADRTAPAAGVVPRAQAGAEQAAAAGSGVGARLPRRLPAGRRLRATAAREDRGRPCYAGLRANRARIRLSLRATVTAPALRPEHDPGRPPGRMGLRTRLLLAFAVLALVTTTITAGVLYWRARTAILQATQDAAATALTDRMKTLLPLSSLPPRSRQMEDLVEALTERGSAALVLFRGQQVAFGMHPDSVPDTLRTAVQSGRVVWQRVEWGDTPMLLVGTQLRLKAQPGLSVPSGLEVYLARNLSAERRSINELTWWAVAVGGVSLGLAAVLAWLAAAGVLRPVRELRQAARRLGEGDLSARVAVRGSDELAEVGRTFNSTARVLEHQVNELRRMEADARRFVADVSHELRTPLAAMTAVTDVLDEEAGRLPGDAGRAARLVSGETANLTQLVND